MRTDISRNTFRQDKYYSSVRRQQGRVDLDADWNEQADIVNQDARLRFIDSMGPVGAPVNDAGFRISTSGDAMDLLVSPGRFYIDGVLVRNENEFSLAAQPDLPGVPLPTTDGDYFAYLKVHERAITALEDTELRETALGGPDTTTRLKVVRQILLSPTTAVDIDSRTVPPEWNALISRNPGTLSARTEADDAQSDPCAVGARGGYTGLDNLLYRVEIHDGGQAGTATYKWSRDNGSLVTEWLEQDGNTLTLRSSGNDNVLNFAPGQWVELSDEGMELEGIAGTLVQILRVEGRRITINPDNIKHFAGSAGTLDIAEFSRGVRKVRRWDNVELTAPPTVPAGEAWITLENGIEVKFDDSASGREYRTGDYWMIPARADSNNIEWRCNNDGNIAHPPHGTHFYYARLAFLNLTAGAWSVTADARRIFPGLTDEELAYVGGDGQLSIPGETLDRPLEVRVTRGSTPVADAKVRFSVTSGTGTIEDTPGGTSATTLDIKSDARGIAQVYWTTVDANAGQSVRAVLLDENDDETDLYVVFGAGSGVASGIQYTPISADTSVAGTTNVQEALDSLADNKVNRAGDTITGDLEVQGNFTVRGDVIARDAEQQAGDVLLGDDDADRVVIHGTLQSNHTSGALEIEAPIRMRTTDPTKSPLRVDGPTTGGSPRLYRRPLELDHTDASAVTLDDYQLLITVDTATPIAAGRMQGDGGDILFEDQDGTLLPFWIESDINTSSTRIWVRLPVITAGENRTIYMLHGNNNAASQSSSAATFVREISDIVLAYKFDEGSGGTSMDYSGAGQDATLNGPTYAAGAIGQALNFNGTNQHVSANVNWPEIGTGDFTMSFRVNPRTITGDARLYFLDQTFDNFQLGTESGSNLRLVLGTSITDTPPIAWSLNTWHHVVVVRRSGTVTFYINGSSHVVHTATNNGNIGQSTTINMGYRSFTSQHPFDGLIDETRILNRAMTIDELDAHFTLLPYLSLANPGVEMLRRFSTLEPTVIAQAEEANPLSEAPILFAQEASGNVGIGTDAPDEKLTVDGIIETKTGGIKFPDGTIQTTAGGPGGGGGEPLPLGTIMAWHRDFAGSPSIPTGWVACDGQVLSDEDSPYDGLVIPNLNGEKRFLRGGDASGTFESDAFQGHHHSIPGNVVDRPGDGFLTNQGFGGPPGVWWNRQAGRSYDPISGNQGSPRIADETRPTNMSVVWIMKIKETGESGLWTPNDDGIHYNAGKVSVGTDVSDEQLTVTGAISLEEKILEPNTTDDFGKIYVRENDLSHLRLNGSDQYVAMPGLGRATIGDFTVGIWFRLRHPNTGNVGNYSYFLDFRGDGTEISKSLVLRLLNSSTGDSTLDHFLEWPGGGSSSFNLSIGNVLDQWHHAAIVRDGDVLRCYHDGRLLSDEPTNTAATSEILDWDHPWRIGTYEIAVADDYFFHGDLDDLGVWERALSGDEIAALHNGGRGSDVPTAFASSLVGFWPMSTGATPGQIDDVSGNGFHGTIQNGGVIVPERVGSLYFKDGFGNVTSLAGGGDSYRTGGSGNQVPLGTIMAWHKSFTNTPAIPDGWVECHGQTLDDPASPYHGQTLPDLNGEERFLRGGDTSGTLQSDELRSHTHQQQTGAFGSSIGNGIRAFTHDGQFPSSLNTLAAGGSETRPVNMSVVWIMKVRETDRDRGLWRESGEDIYFNDGRVGVGAKTANTKLHVSSNDLEEAPFRVDAKITLQGVQGRLYRSAIDLENTDTADLVDQQIPLTLDTAALVSVGKMRFDGADMLFVDSDGKTLVPHFIEAGMNTANTRVWVRVPLIPAGETRRIFIQYGKHDASSIASRETTFARAIDDVAVAYDFDEGSGGTLTDVSGNGNTASGGGVWSTGYRGSALSFSGGSSMETGFRTWGFSTSVTVSAWIKTAQVAPGGNTATVMSLDHGNLNDEVLMSVFQSGELVFTSHNSPGVYRAKHGTSNVLTGEWVHIVGVLDGGIESENIRVYVNGVLEEGAFDIVGSAFPISDATPRSLRIGHRRTGVPEFFVGEIDLFRMYAGALTDREIADLYSYDSLFIASEPGRENLYKHLPVPPATIVAAEEPNPVSGSPVLFAQNLTGNIGIGTDEPAAKLHIVGEAGIDGIMFPDGTLQTTAGGPGGGGDSTPLGTIIAWHKNLSGTPAIPIGWVECNGQPLDDPDSPFHGEVIPNLNGQKESWNSKGSFLRGGTTSGQFEDDQFQGHFHDLFNGTGVWRQQTGSALNPGVNNAPANLEVREPTTDGTNGEPRFGGETRPVNMSVVWIMKVKQIAGQSGLWSIGPDGIRYDDGKVSVGTAIADEQLTVSGAISLEEKILEPNTTDDFGKIYVRENDLSYIRIDGEDQSIDMPGLNRPAVGDFTIGIWFKIEDPTRTTEDNWIFDTREINAGGPDIEAIVEAGTNGEYNIKYSYQWADGTHTQGVIALGPIIGLWQHFAVAREGSETRLYVNGRLVKLGADTGPAPRSETLPWDKPWRVGRRSDDQSTGHRTFPGSLDDLGMWERALSQDEIATLYNSGRGSDVPTAFASALVGFWPMTMGATTGQVDDASGNGFHGTLQGGATIVPERVGSLYFKDGFGNVTALAGGGDSYRTGGSGNQVPLGTIMAWHKSFTNTPAIPDGWVQCDGQTLDDPASPYHGQTIPDLNNPKESWNSRGSFLRGDNSSGDFQDDAFQGHRHANLYTPTRVGHPSAPSTTPAGNTHSDGGALVGDPTTDSVNGTPRTSTETVPVNMSVVWIMKVRETDRDRGLWREQGEDIYFDDGNVGVGAKTANAKLHISTGDAFEAPLRVDGQVTLQGVQGRLYRLPITLSNSSGNDLFDYEAKLTIDTANLIAQGKLRHDGADILFVDEDGKTVLPHFVQTGINTTATEIWVRVPTIRDGSTREIFLQYGRSDASDQSSPEATFRRVLDGLAAAYNFDEGTGSLITDLSGNGNNATHNAGYAAGYNGQALSVSGGTRAVLDTPRNWGFDTSCTISAWVKTTATTGTGTIAMLDHGNLLDSPWLAVFPDGKVSMYSHNSSGVFVRKTGTSNVLTGQWVHVVGVLDGGVDPTQVRVYINGVREEGDTIIGGSPAPISDTTPRTLHIGTSSNSSANWFNGEIDQVRIYGRALTDPEIADLHALSSLISPDAPAREFLPETDGSEADVTFATEEPNPVSGTPILFAQNLTGNVGVGTDDPLGKLHVAGTAGVDGIVFPDGSLQTTAAKAGGGDTTPIGTIIAWHKSLTGTPAIPDGWVECNGQTLDDMESTYHGRVIPDLNSDERFLRGGTTSGDLQEDAFQGHHHRFLRDGGSTNVMWWANGSAGGDGGLIQRGSLDTGQEFRVVEPEPDGTNGTPRTADETRPVNMSVVWIMKVKQIGDLAWEPAPGGIAYAGDVAIGTTAPNSKLTIDGALALSETSQTPSATHGFGKIFARESTMRHLTFQNPGDYVSLPAVAAGVGDFTLSAWVKLESADNRENVILDLRGDGSTGFGAGLWLNVASSGSVVLNHFITNTANNTTQFLEDIGYLQGQWHHTALVREGTLMRAYVDGIPVSTSLTESGSVVLNAGRIGNRSTVVGDQAFRGDIAQVAVWDRAIVPYEMAAIFVAGREVDLTERYQAHLVGYWPVDESDDTTLLDHSGNDFHGTLQGNITYAGESTGSLYYKDGQGSTSFLAGSRGFPLSIGASGREVPVGTIMAWHKSLTGTPAMPPGWVECNGQLLNDGQSPYDGQTIPNLNGDPAGADSPDVADKKSMFLRGGLTSGTGQDDAFQGHRHDVVQPPSVIHGASGDVDRDGGASSSSDSIIIGDPISDSVNGTPRTADETRPVNMSVVWIMKIKHTGNGAWEPVSSGLAFTGNRVGIGTTTPSFELDVNGSVQCVNLLQTSDARKKTDVETVSGALDLVERLRGVRFKWHPDAATKLSPAHDTQLGLIAQEVEAVMPEVVSTTQDGYKAIEYGKLTALLIEAVKELKDKL